jgi:hypothetical protein
VLAAASGGWWSGPRDCQGFPSADCVDGHPHGFYLLSIDGPDYETRFVPAARKGETQIRCSIVSLSGPTGANAVDAGAVLDQGALDRYRLVANVFDGGPNTRVSYQVAGEAEPIAMQRTTAPDPVTAALFEHHRASFQPWMRAMPTSHIWSAALPTSLMRGAHRITVRARNEFGVEHVAHKVLEIGSEDKLRA